MFFFCDFFFICINITCFCCCLNKSTYLRKRDLFNKQNKLSLTNTATTPCVCVFGVCVSAYCLVMGVFFSVVCFVWVTACYSYIQRLLCLRVLAREENNRTNFERDCFNFLFKTRWDLLGNLIIQY